MTVYDVLTQYESKIRELETGIARQTLSLPVGAVVLAIAFLLYVALSAIRGEISFFWLLMPIPMLVISVRQLHQSRQSRSRMWRLKNFYTRAVQRVRGNWAGKGVDGDDFDDPDHVYARDLHIFGEGSLFELLSIARTSIGRRGLANYLLVSPPLEEAQLRQDAVRELRNRIDLREKIATVGELDFLESKWSTFEDWLDSPRMAFSRLLPIAAALTSGLLAELVLAGFAKALPWDQVEIWIGLIIACHAAVGLYFRERVNRMIEWVRPVSVETRVLREGLALLAAEKFQSAKLRSLTDQVRNGSASIRKLERLLGALAQRDKDLFQLPSRVLLMGTQLCIAIEQWRATHGEALKGWLEAWSEFEALNALASYGFENPDHVFPEFSAGRCFEAKDLGHPMLPRDLCVFNDVELNASTRFYVISGSNMSGKSTLLRSIGLNAVLAFAGAPVRARALRISGLSTFASLSVVDSLLNGKSKFLAEVERLRLAIESNVENKSVLFLVDEIFSGTNSRDRHIAAEAVVRTLVNRGAIGALSTHDLALTEIASAEGMCGVNVHMGSKDEQDPMDFDYRLKPGVTQEANALAIARMAGVPV